MLSFHKRKLLSSTVRLSIRNQCTSFVVHSKENEKPPFKKLMAANRGEIATRIMRAGNELGFYFNHI